MASNDSSAAGQYFYNGLQQRGYSPMQAAVLAGNMQQESGFDPTRVNAREGAFGSLQWRQSRLAGLQNYAGSVGKSATDPDVQMDYVVREMQGPEAQNALPFLSATDPQSANAALKGYIRYGDGSQPTRLKYAMAFLPPAANGNGAATGGQPSGGQPGNSAPAPAGNAPQATQPSSNASDRAQFLSQWGVTAPAASGASSAPPAPAAAAASSAPVTSGASPDRAAFLNSWGVNTGAAPASGSAAPVAQPTSAPSQPIATGPGTYAGKPVTPGAAGNNAMAVRKSAPVGNSLTGYTPSSVPWLDPVAAFADSAINAIPVVGGPMMQGINHLDAGLNNLLGFPTETPDQRGAIIQGNNAQYPAASVAGAVAGTVAPFLAVGPEGLAAKALGTASDYGYGAGGNLLMRTAAGAGSGAALAGADTATRGGDANAIIHNMLTAAAIGGGAASALHGIGNAGEAVGRWFQGGASAPQTLANALMQDRLAPQNVNMLTHQMGPGATVADVGQTTQNLAANLAGAPGPAQDIVRSAIEARAANAGNRLPDAVSSTLGKGQPVGGLTDQIVAQQKAAADPLYQAVRNTPVQVTPPIQSIMDTETPFTPTVSTVVNQINKQAAAPGGLTVGFLDRAKQALDDASSEAAQAGKGNAARDASTLATKITSEVDTQLGGAPGTGPYAQARAAFAGPAKVLDAVNMGQKVFTKSIAPEDLQNAMATMSPSERDGLLQGAQAAAQEMIGNASSDAAGVRNTFRSSNAQQKLATLIGRQQAQALSDAIESHAALSGTENAVSNSVNQASQGFAQSAVGPVQPSNVSFKGLAKLIDVPALFMKARNAYANSYRAAQNVHLANMLTGSALSPEDAAAVAGANHLPGGGVPGAAVALGVKNNLPGPQNPFLSAGPDQIDRVYRDGKWIPRIVVRGANVIGQ